MKNTTQHHEQQIGYLLQLQDADRELDILEEQRGNLPELVTKLVTKIEELEKKHLVLQARVEEYKKAVNEQEKKYKDASQAVKAYEKKSKAAKTEQEYASINKILELANLDVQLSQKKMREHKNIISKEEIRIQELNEEIQKQQKVLLEKKKTLQEIDDAKQEKVLQIDKARTQIVKKLDVPFYTTYENIRKKQPDVLTGIQNSACNGCFIIIPLQTQIHVQTHEKVITCENCCRIFAHVEFPQEEAQEKKRTRKPRKKQETGN